MAAPLSTQTYSGDSAFLSAITPGSTHNAIAEFRWGSNTLSGDWEVALGTNTQTSNQVNKNTTWGGAKAFSLAYDGAGNLALDFGGTSSFLTYPGATGKPAIDPTGFNALALRTDGRKGDSSITGLTFNGMSFGPLTATDSVEYVILQGVDVASAWTLSGTISFAQQGDNKGSQPSFQVKLSDVPQVPLPAAIWSLVAALSGLGVIGRTRRSAAA